MDQELPVLTPENSEVDIPLKHIAWMAGLVVIPLILITFVIPLFKPADRQATKVSTVAVLPTPATSLLATVISVKGSANLSRNNQALPAVVNLAVLPKDTLETGAESNLGILFDDGSILRLEQNSKVQISEYTHQGDAWVIILDQLWGRTWNRVQKLTASSVYEVRTATAVASVRGTSFGVDTSDTSSAINVSEGTVIARIMDKPSVTISAPNSTPAKVIKEVTISPKQQVDIKKSDVEIIRRQVETKLPQILAINATNTEPAKIPEWVVRNNEEDKKIAPIFEKIRQEREKQTSRPVETQQENREFIREIVKEIVPSPTSMAVESSPTLSNPPIGCHWQTVQCVTTPCNPILVCETPTTSSTVIPTVINTIVPTVIPAAGTQNYTPNSILANPTYAAYYEQYKNKITPTSTPTPVVGTNTSSSTSDTTR